LPPLPLLLLLPPLPPLLPLLLPTPPFGLPSGPVEVWTTTPLSSVVRTEVSLTVAVVLPLWTVIESPPPVVVVGSASVGLAKIMVQKAIEKKRFIVKYSIGWLGQTLIAVWLCK